MNLSSKKKSFQKILNWENILIIVFTRMYQSSKIKKLKINFLVENNIEYLSIYKLGYEPFKKIWNRWLKRMIKKKKKIFFSFFTIFLYFLKNIRIFFFLKNSKSIPSLKANLINIQTQLSNYSIIWSNQIIEFTWLSNWVFVFSKKQLFIVEKTSNYKINWQSSCGVFIAQLKIKKKKTLKKSKTMWCNFIKFLNVKLEKQKKISKKKLFSLTLKNYTSGYLNFLIFLKKLKLLHLCYFWYLLIKIIYCFQKKKKIKAIKRKLLKRYYKIEKKSQKKNQQLQNYFYY